MKQRKAISGRGGPPRSGPPRNDRLKQVLLRDKPEMIRLRPKHFFPLLNRGKKVYPLLPPPTTTAKPFWPGLRALDGHPFSFNAFIYRPLLFLSTPPPFHPPFLTPS